MQIDEAYNLWNLLITYWSVVLILHHGLVSSWSLICWPVHILLNPLGKFLDREIHSCHPRFRETLIFGQEPEELVVEQLTLQFMVNQVTTAPKKIKLKLC